MDIVGVGDAILARRISRSSEAALGPVTELIRNAHAAYVNFEMVTPSLPAIPSAAPIALRCAAPPWVIDELTWMGFDLLGLANNHADDYGYVGLRDTIEQMEARRLTFAGAGRNLEEARMPSYLDCREGRVALICVTSSGAMQSLASDGLGVIGSRPGTNPLRFGTEYRLEPSLFDQLLRIDNALGSAEMSRRLLSLGVFPGFDGKNADVYRFAGKRFVRSGESRILTTPHQQDIDHIGRWISEARRSADVVVVGLHSHEGAAEGWNVEEPADFIAASAHAFIDAGAHVVFGHGPHRLRGIEIYHGCPIFYSLGNFLFLDETISIVDPQQFALFGLDERSTPADLHDWREQWPDGTPRGFHSQGAYWESILAKCHFAGSACASVDLYPLDLALDQPRLTRGLPRVATRETGLRILKEVARLSEDTYGTSIDMIPSGESFTGRIPIFSGQRSL